MRLRLILIIPPLPHKCLYDVYRDKFTFFTVIFTDVIYKNCMRCCQRNNENVNRTGKIETYVHQTLFLCIFFTLPNVPT